MDATELAQPTGEPFTGIRHNGRFRACTVEGVRYVQMAGGPVRVLDILLPVTGERMTVNAEQVTVSLCVRAE